MKKNLCDIATLASFSTNDHEEKDHNVVKVITDKSITNKSVLTMVFFLYY